MKYRLHSSSYFLILLISFLLSLIVNNIILVRAGVIIPLVLGVFLIILFILQKQTKIKIILMIMIGFCVGFARSDILVRNKLFFNNLEGEFLELSGKLFEDVEENKTGQLILRLGDLMVKNKQIPGSLLVITPNKKVNLKRGDEITIAGQIKAGMGGYSAQISKATIKSIKSNSSFGLQMRDYFTNNLEKNLNPDEANLANAFLTGKRRTMDSKFVKQLQVVGLIHLVVASGFHLGTIVRTTKRIFSKVSKKMVFIMSFVGIIGFNLITGISPSMLRASMVSGMSLLAWFYGRKMQPLRLFVIVLCLSVFYNPFYIQGDASWLLSFASFYGILAFAPTARSYFYGDKKLGFFKQLFTETLSAQIATLPITIGIFGKLSLIGLLTNLLVVPVSSLVMLLAFLLSIFNNFGFVTTILKTILSVLIQYIIKVTEIGSAVPYASVEMKSDWSFILVIIIMILGINIYMWHQNKKMKISNEFNFIE